MEIAHANTRVYGLDMLRALAIVCVMLSHSFDYSQYLLSPNYYSWLIFDGVTLFFVLSGFLIGGLLIKTVQNSVAFDALLQFWLRRWFRTLPNYYLVLIVLAAAYYMAHQCLPPQLWRYFTFTQNFAGPHPLFFGEAWSLSVEEWFYLLVPAGLFIVLRLIKKPQQAVLIWALIVLVISTGIRIAKVAGHDYLADGSFGQEIVKQVITRLDSLLYGVLGAWFSMYRPAQWAKHRNVLFASGLLLLYGCNVYRSDLFLGYVYFSLTPLAVLLLLPKLSSIKTGQGRVYKAITFISVISYSMYLINHMIVQRAIIPGLQKVLHFSHENNPGCVITLLLFWTLTILLSYGLYRFWEQPVMKLRDRIGINNRISRTLSR